MNRALTLIELLISIAISVIIFLALYYFIQSGLMIWTRGQERADLTSQGRLAIDRLTRELRQARAITSAQANSITFTADLTNDSVDNPTTISYALSGSNLLRSEGGQSPTIAAYVSSFALTYADSNTLITINLTLLRGTTTVALTSTVKNRNI